jgi:hypothetical protein
MQNNTMTGFELAKIASERLNRNVRPQMVYNYIRKGKIETVQVGDKTLVTLEGAAAFIKNLANGTVIDREARLADLTAALDELI